MAGVQADASVGIGPRRPVFQVSLDRAADVRELAADLVVAAGEQHDLHEAIPFGAADEPVTEPCQFGVPAFPGGADETLVDAFVAPHPVFEQSFRFARLRADQGPVGLSDGALAEQGGHPLQGLGGLGQHDDAADRPVQPVGEAHEHLPGLAVPFGDERLAGVGQALVPGLVALHDLARLLVQDKQVVVFVEDPCGEVRRFFGGESSVFHGMKGWHKDSHNYDNLTEK